MAENSPPISAIMLNDPDYDKEVDTYDIKGEDAPPQPLSNPPFTHKLITKQYSSLEHLKTDLHKYTASIGFHVIHLKSSNLIKGFNYSTVLFNC